VDSAAKKKFLAEDIMLIEMKNKGTRDQEERVTWRLFFPLGTFEEFSQNNNFPL
jgi:hypothetical protein